MTYQNTSATDLKDLLGKVRDFAVADGWAATYDAIAGSSSMGLSKGAASIAFQGFHDTHVDALTTLTVDDYGFYWNPVIAFVGGKTTHWEHNTGGVITSLGDNDASRVNDLTGPFPNVWLFSNAAQDCVHVVAQQGTKKFTHFSFGLLDVNGLTQPQAAYVAGQYWHFWAESTDYSNNLNASNFNTVVDGFVRHSVGHFGEKQQNRPDGMVLMVPTGIMDGAYSFPTGDLVTAYGYVLPNHSRMDLRADAISGGFGVIGLPGDFFPVVDNIVTTGGVPLTRLPIFYRLTSASFSAIRQYLGDLPEVRLVNISDLSVGQEIVYASDTWVVFPLKQKGLFEESSRGANPQPIVNSIQYGFAYKKIV